MVGSPIFMRGSSAFKPSGSGKTTLRRLQPRILKPGAKAQLIYVNFLSATLKRRSPLLKQGAPTLYQPNILFNRPEECFGSNSGWRPSGSG